MPDLSACTYSAFTENDGTIHSARADDHLHCALEQPQWLDLKNVREGNSKARYNNK